MEHVRVGPAQEHGWLAVYAGGSKSKAPVSPDPDELTLGQAIETRYRKLLSRNKVREAGSLHLEIFPSSCCVP